MAEQSGEILVWGAGGHGRVVADAAEAAGFRVIGFIDDDATKVGRRVGTSSWSVVIDGDRFLAAGTTVGAGAANHIALGVGDNAARLALLKRLTDRSLPPIIHPSAVVSRSATISRGTLLCAMAVVNPDARLGAGVIINTGAIVEHDCVLADGVHVSPGAVLAGEVTVGQSSWIGANAVVIPSRSIGSASIVGAGSVVLQDVPDRTIVAGNPARLLRQL